MAHHCDVAPCKTAKFGRAGAPLPIHKNPIIDLTLGALQIRAGSAARILRNKSASLTN